MPLIRSQYFPPAWLRSGHLQTLWPFTVRRLRVISQPAVIPLPDGDQLVADYYPCTHTSDDRLLVIAHGLEGNSQRPYVQGLARAAQAQGFAVLAWNFRSCGRADNLTERFYNAGCSDDLDAVITWAGDYGHQQVYLAGFSMGGNVTLKWLGEAGADAADRGVAGAVAISVPCDLMGCTHELGRPSNTLYRRRFVSDLKARLRRKAARFPGHFDLSALDRISTVLAFDDAYTAPMYGYRDAADYYRQCSSLGFLNAIRVPTLILNARNDPFLSDTCYPEAIARAHQHVYLEVPDQGGHVGFFSRDHHWWADQRAMSFLSSVSVLPPVQELSA